MAGLLGDSWDDPRTQATLQLAAGLLGGGNFGQALGRGLEGYQGTMAAAKRQAMIDEEMTRRKQEREAEQAQLAAKQAEALRIENVVRGSLMPVSGARAIGQDAGGPTQAKAALIGQVPKLDANALLAQGVPYERVKALFEAQNLGRDEVDRTAEIEGPNGQKIIQGFNKWGGRVGEGVSGYVAPQLVNQGDRQTFVKPSAGVSLGVGMSPAERDAAARGWATNALARERLIFDKAGGAEGGKPQLVDGQWVYKPDAQNPNGRVVPVQGIAEKPIQAFSDRVAKLNDLEGALADYKKSVNENSGTMWGLGAVPKHIPVPFSDNGIPLPQGATTTDLSAKYTTMMMGLKDLYSLGALAGPDMKVLEGNLQDPATFKGFLTSKGSFDKQIQVVEDMVKRAKTNTSAAYGNRPIPEAAKPSKNIPAAAINDLKMRIGDPRAAAQFDEVFGAGSAASVMGNK